MSLVGLVAYGDSDNSDFDDNDSNSAEESGQKTSENDQPQSRKEEGSVSEGDIRNSSTPDLNINDLNRANVIGTVDDIEDEDFEYESHTITNRGGTVHSISTYSISGTASGLGLKLPPPKNPSGETTLFGSKGHESLKSRATVHEDSVLDDRGVLYPSSVKQSILSDLPAPKTQSDLSRDLDEEGEIEDEIKEKTCKLAALAPPKPAKRQPVKITVPSMQDYDSDEEDRPTKKRIKKSSGKSGLFALLPDPKNASVKTTNRPLIPHTLTKKPPQKPASLPRKPAATKASVLPGIPAEISDDEDDTEGSVSFFSFGDSKTSSKINMAPTVEESDKVEPNWLGPWQHNSHVLEDESLKPQGPSRGTAVSTGASLGVEQGGSQDGLSYSQASASHEQYPETSADYQQYQHQQYGETPTSEVNQYLQDEEFLKIVGKRQRGKEKIDFIDLQAQEHTPMEQLTKNITEEVSGFSYSKKRDDLPSSQSRRKHQITYLAYQAKERELELKNQWALNKSTKRATQNKYGF